MIVSSGLTSRAIFKYVEVAYLESILSEGILKNGGFVRRVLGAKFLSSKQCLL